MSFRRKHIKSKIHGSRHKKPIFRMLWFWLVFLFLLAIISCAYFVYFYPEFQIKNILISGNQHIKIEDLQSVVEAELNQKILGLGSFSINSKSMFGVNLEKIKTGILNKFPEIESLSVIREFPQTLKIMISERLPAGIFCGYMDQCFWIDKNGIAYEKITPEKLSSNWPIIRVVAENKDFFIGENVVAQNIVSAISIIQKDLEDNFQINLAEAIITNPVRLSIKTGEGWQIYFNLDQNYSIDLQIKKLDLLLGGEISVSARNNLKYIDLRSKDRAIICDNSTCGK